MIFATTHKLPSLQNQLESIALSTTCVYITISERGILFTNILRDFITETPKKPNRGICPLCKKIDTWGPNDVVLPAGGFDSWSFEGEWMGKINNVEGTLDLNQPQVSFTLADNGDLLMEQSTNTVVLKTELVSSVERASNTGKVWVAGQFGFKDGTPVGW